MTDIVERLRGDWPEVGWRLIRFEAVAEIERLRNDTQMLWDAVAEKNAEIERLKERLKKIAEHPSTPELIRQYARGDI